MLHCSSGEEPRPSLLPLIPHSVCLPSQTQCRTTLSSLPALFRLFKKLLTAVEEKRCVVSAQWRTSVDVKLIAATQAEMSSHRATAESQ